ncbi:MULTISPECIES: 30S ribosomal protein S6 [Desulfosediminicola]|uniref:30S ribosomal protein S6 n=1 Tax=Desulfosediminicola TaxID=2886823 RepID=UPI0010AC5083|nr:30S ribosomal protein S6 [Desulfosediminicola ganghwensis]
MRRYELILILRPSLGEAEITTVIDYTTKIISDENGTIIDLNKWGMKKLAYPIKKELQGYYVFCEYAGTPAAVAEIERKYRIDDAVLKYLTIKTAESMTDEEIQAAIGETEARKAAAAKEAEEAAEAEAGTEAETAEASETEEPAAQE